MSIVPGGKLKYYVEGKAKTPAVLKSYVAPQQWAPSASAPERDSWEYADDEYSDQDEVYDRRYDTREDGKWYGRIQMEPRAEDYDWGQLGGGSMAARRLRDDSSSADGPTSLIGVALQRAPCNDHRGVFVSLSVLRSSPLRSVSWV